MDRRRALYPLLAELLEYPRPNLREKALRARDLLAEMTTHCHAEPSEASPGAARGDPSLSLRMTTHCHAEPQRSISPTKERSFAIAQDDTCQLHRGLAIVQQFASFVENTSPDRIEEIYTATFDLNPTCYPYVGYHLFGDDPQRAELMVKLQESYREAGLNTEGELPDHAALMLRYLAALDDPELADEMVELLMAPALEKMAGLLGDDNPYRNLVRGALLLVRSAACEVR